MRSFLVFLTAVAALLLGVPLLAQKYSGPRPPKPDIPYLFHADNLVETEVTEAKEEERKDTLVYVTSGASSPVRTPMAEPIFLMQSEKIPPEKLSLFQLRVKDGNREIVVPQKKKDKGPRPIRITLSRLDEGLYRIEANQTLDNGEYCFSPDGSNQVFCFEAY